MILNKIRIFIVAFVSVACLILAPIARADDYRRPELPDRELKELNAAISRSRVYDARKVNQLDSLKRLLSLPINNSPEKRFNICYNISSSYSSNNADSAFSYARECVKIASEAADDVMRIKAQLAMTTALSVAGIFPQALTLLDSVRKSPLTRPLRIEMWKAGRRLYSYMMSYLTDKSPIYEAYREQYLAFDDSLLMNLPKTDDYYYFLRGERAVVDGKYAEAKKILGYLLDRVKIESNLYGMAAFQMAEVYRNQGDETRYASLLAKAATSDIMAAVKEGYALPELAKWLYDQGKLDEAFNYINFALEDATSSNARMRTVTIASFVPIIDQAYRKKINDSHDRLMASFICSLLLVIVAAVLLFYLQRQIKRSHESRVKLEHVAAAQESYIGSFVALCSSYADRLDSLCNLVAVKISSGQTDELIKQIKSGRFGNDKNEEFYDKFDAAFLDLYPDFVMRINRLLREEEQIILKKGEMLTPELRIYAFVKLGVEESTRIAQVLHYSVSTIYAYRNKMRNKAINRDSFDADVAAIKRGG